MLFRSLSWHTAHDSTDLVFNGNLTIVSRTTGDEDGAVRGQGMELVDHETFEAVFERLEKRRG